MSCSQVAPEAQASTRPAKRRSTARGTSTPYRIFRREGRAASVWAQGQARGRLARASALTPPTHTHARTAHLQRRQLLPRLLQREHSLGDGV